MQGEKVEQITYKWREWKKDVNLALATAENQEK